MRICSPGSPNPGNLLTCGIYAHIQSRNQIQMSAAKEIRSHIHIHNMDTVRSKENSSTRSAVAEDIHIPAVHTLDAWDAAAHPARFRSRPAKPAGTPPHYVQC